MASVFAEDWEYRGITAREYKEAEWGLKRRSRFIYARMTRLYGWRQPSAGMPGPEHEYVRITYDGTDVTQDDYWEQGDTYQINGKQVDQTEYQAAFYRAIS